MLFHWLLSRVLFLHPWIPRTRRSCSTLSRHLIGGLPFFLLPSIFVNVTFLHGSVSLARYRYPSHLSLPAFIILIISIKKISPVSRHGGAWGERRYSSYSFTTSVLDGGEWSASRPGRALPRRKDPRYPLYRRLGGPQSRSGQRG
jgi:hypothetical protein